MSSFRLFGLRGNARDSYIRCVQAYPLLSITSDYQLRTALAVIDRMLARNRGEQVYLDALSDLVASYEDEHHPIPPASDADMLCHLLAAKGITQAELHRATGISKSSISEILAGKKHFTRPMIRKLADYFGIDARVLAAGI